MCKLTIFTPTYNRSYILKNAYTSLINQTNKNFEWFIVDGVSTDNTKELINEFVSEKIIDIRFEENRLRSKYSAILNFGVPLAKGEIILFLDSDDYLEDDAVEQILSAHEKYNNVESIAGYYFKCRYLSGIEIKPLKDEQIVHSLELGQSRQDKVDTCCQIYKLDKLREFKYPTFGNEYFTPESVIWNTIDQKYKIVTFNKIIYCREYQTDGYTSSGRKKNIENPLSSMYSAKFLIEHSFKFKYKVKGAILFACYGFFAKMKFKEIIGQSSKKFLVMILGIPFGLVFYNLWRRKFKIN